jgi:hypothetical protein
VDQLKGHRLSEAAISLLRRLTGPENLGTNAEWLKLQPRLSDVRGENWEERSQGWNGPSEGKSVEMASCFDALALDLQAAILGDRHPSPPDWLIDVEDNKLQSVPRSQEYLEAPDTALLRSCFPHLFAVSSATLLGRTISRDFHGFQLSKVRSHLRTPHRVKKCGYDPNNVEL